MQNIQDRRDFLKQLGFGCSGMYATSLLSGITSMGLINAAAAANAPLVTTNSNYKALVCVLLQGGNDSFNMLIPRGTDEYNDYAQVRTGAAIPQNALLSINPLNSDGKEYGLHPNLPRIKTLFDNQNLSFVANVGTLVNPTDLAGYRSGNAIPKYLFSHSDQGSQWMTSLPDNPSITGWGGRLADILRTNNANQNISMNLSIQGVNLFQQGNDVTPISLSPSGNGVTLLNNSSNTGFYETLKRQTVDNLLDNSYQNILHTAYSENVRDAKGNSFELDAALSAAPAVNTVFPTALRSDFGGQLNMVAKLIAARDVLNVSQQTFFVTMGGFDTHGSIDEHYDLMDQLDRGLSAFYDSLVEIGIENNVTTFTISDFARGLVSNGNGTDHAWGGNAIVMGGAVNGGKIYGQYPDIYLGHPLDVGGGRFIPSTSTDEYFADLALWFGASNADLDQILPNIGRFWDTANPGAPLGLLTS